jgi:hypothetical protein
MRKYSMTILLVGAATAIGSFAMTAEAANYGCFKVTTSSLHIRARPYSNADILSTASKGDILEKRKWLCTLRGFWCAVRQGSIEGYADKAFMEKVKCP